MFMDFQSDKRLSSNRLDDWITRRWYRTMAVQCSDDQPRFDKVIPMYYLAPLSTSDTTSQVELEHRPESSAHLVSYILISDRDDAASNEEHIGSDEEYATPDDEDAVEPDLNSTSPKSKGSGSHNPHIFIQCDLQAKAGDPTFALTREPEGDDTCLRIYAPGVNAQTYPFLTKLPGIEPLLKSMVDWPTRSKGRCRTATFLQNQALFGTTSKVEHMGWESAAG